MTQPADVPPDHAKVERAIVFQLLRDDLDERWSLTGLADELDVERSALASALERLQQHGVVAGGDAIGAAPAARRLDALGVIAI
jgi:Na+-translocating ferredoxin:NAD+ oxidoreductase RnfC subunit